MNKYIKTLVEDTLSYIDELKNIPDLDREWIDSYIKENYSNVLNEMARINKNEFYGYFPSNKFEIKIWSNDHNPPHFHVISAGWNIVVEIETGNILKTKSVGTDSKIYKYVEDHIKDWLSQKSRMQKKLTNKEVAQQAWELIHD